MKYIELVLNVEPLEPWSDLIIDDLGQIGFESFTNEDFGIKAYIQEDLLQKSQVDIVLKNYSSNCKISDIQYYEIPEVNWNEEWEKNFEPIIVDDQCAIKSSFHQLEKKYPIEILIDPKMSFGTGHHATTFLMIQKLLEIDVKNKTVLDMGCGTAVLAILAKIKGAGKTVAIDIDEWAYHNSVENISINKQKIEVYEGGSELILNQTFDIILANINLNILLQDMPNYVHSLIKGGTILFSGVMFEDKDKLIVGAQKFGLLFVEERMKNNWMMFHFEKP
jgi:ribosomal protein L11 methyltransferase